MKYYLDCLKKYAVFSGRSRRSEYYSFLLWSFIGYFILLTIINMAGNALSTIHNQYVTFIIGSINPIVFLLIDSSGKILSIAYWVVMIIPLLAVTIRRLHDADYFGWYILLLLIPFLGTLTLIVITARDSEIGINKWGSDPKINEREKYGQINEIQMKQLQNFVNGKKLIVIESTIMQKNNPTINSGYNTVLEKAEQVTAYSTEVVNGETWTKIKSHVHKDAGWILSNKLEE